MSTLSEMTIGSKVVLEVLIKNTKLEFETVIKYIVEKPSKQYGYGIACEQIFSDKGALLSFKGVNVVANIENASDKRNYQFLLSVCVNNKSDKTLVMFSTQDIKPKNYRDTFRVLCGYRTTMQIGNNRKAIDGHVHDISFTGISFTYDSNKIKSDVGQNVSAMIYEGDKDDHGYRVSADIVRINDTWAENKTLIGAKFDDSINNRDVNKLVAKCQIKEMRIRRDNKQ